MCAVPLPAFFGEQMGDRVAEDGEALLTPSSFTCKPNELAPTNLELANLLSDTGLTEIE